MTYTIDPIDAPVIKDYPSEIRSSDRFYANGTAVPGGWAVIHIERDGRQVATSSVPVDAGGNWSYIHGQGLEDGRYSFWVRSVNGKGFTSLPSEKPSFLVSAPVFAVIGGWVVEYFTVLVSLIFLIFLIVLMVFLIVWLIRKKLKKETYEVEAVLKRNSNELKEAIDLEFNALAKVETKAAFKTETAKSRECLKQKVDDSTARSLKEIGDVEKIIK